MGEARARCGNRTNPIPPGPLRAGSGVANHDSGRARRPERNPPENPLRGNRFRPSGASARSLKLETGGSDGRVGRKYEPPGRIESVCAAICWGALVRNDPHLVRSFLGRLRSASSRVVPVFVSRQGGTLRAIDRSVAFRVMPAAARKAGLEDGIGTPHRRRQPDAHSLHGQK